MNIDLIENMFVLICVKYAMPKIGFETSIRFFSAEIAKKRIMLKG